MSLQTPWKRVNGRWEQWATGDYGGIPNGMLGISTMSAGALFYASSLDTGAALAIGSAGQVLQSTGSSPQWTTDIAGVAAGRRCIYGSSSSDGDLALVPSSHATQGHLYFGVDGIANGGFGSHLNAHTDKWSFQAGAFTAGSGLKEVCDWILAPSDGQGVSMSVGDGMTFTYAGVNSSISYFVLGRMLWDARNVTAGAEKARFRIQLQDTTDYFTVYEVDENANHHLWALGNTTLATLTPTLLTLASGVGLTMTSGTATLTSGNLVMSSGIISQSGSGINVLRRDTAGTSNLLDLTNRGAGGTGAGNDNAHLRFVCSDDAGNAELVAGIAGGLVTATAGAEVGFINFATALAGSNAARLRIHGDSFINSTLPVGINLTNVTTAPARNLEVRDSSNPQLRLTHTIASKYAEMKVDTSSVLTWSINGNDRLTMDSSGNLAGTFGWTDVTTGNVSTSAHGLVPKAPNVVGQFLRHDGTWGYDPMFAFCSTDRTTSSTSLGNITDLTLPLVANAKYEFVVEMSVASSSAAGNRFAMQYSAAGASIEAQIVGTTSGPTAVQGERITAFNTAATVMTTLNGAGVVRIAGMVETGANAGNLTVQFLKVTSGTATVRKYAFLRAERKA